MSRSRLFRQVERVGVAVAAFGLAVFAGAQPQNSSVKLVPVDPLVPASQQEQPWPGVLETQSIYLHASLSIYAFEKPVDQSPLWRFRGGGLDSVKALLTAAEVPAPLAEVLLGSAVPWRSGGGITLLPTPETIMGLSAKSRQRIYEELAQWSSNRYHFAPLLVPRDIVDDWLAHTQLSATQRELMRQLFWDRGGCFAFSDISLMLKTATNARETNACLHAMTQIRAVIVRLRVPPRDRLSSVVNYWSAPPNQTDAFPFLQSAMDSGVESIEVMHLLPPLCRRWLYTFPSLASETGGRFPDCAWTSLNFFAAAPEPYYIDSNSSSLELRDNYQRIPLPTNFGDLICFTDKAGQIAHTCVFVADKIVFTKNGTGLSSPWLLAPYSDVEAMYRFGDVTEVRYFRKKTATPRDD